MNADQATPNDAIHVVQVDYRNEQHAADLIALLDSYAGETAGGGQPLSPEVRRVLVPRLAQRDDAVSMIAYAGDQAVGLINAIEGFSTFAAKPLLNIHDVVVRQDWRGQGIAARLLQAAQDVALRRGCCKLTLEVLSQNRSAVNAYRRFGFADYQLDPRFGRAILMEKKIDPVSESP